MRNKLKNLWLPRPVDSVDNRCSHCGGTGADAAKTFALNRSQSDRSYVQCWACNGNGLNPIHPN